MFNNSIINWLITTPDSTTTRDHKVHAFAINITYYLRTNKMTNKHYVHSKSQFILNTPPPDQTSILVTNSELSKITIISLHLDGWFSEFFCWALFEFNIHEQNLFQYRKSFPKLKFWFQITFDEHVGPTNIHKYLLNLINQLLIFAFIAL